MANKPAPKTASRRRRRGPKKVPGTAPGTLHTDPNAPAPELHLIAYDGDELIEITGPDALLQLDAHRRPGRVVWLNVDGLGNAETITEVGRRFNLHRLSLEDVVNVHQRAKVDPFDDNIYVVLRMLTYVEQLDNEQISLFCGPGYVVTFQERAGDCLEPVRTRLRADRGRLRDLGSDYLAYAIIDAVIDHLFPLLEAYGTRLDELEEEVLSGAAGDTVIRLQRMRRELSTVRRMVWPLRDTVVSLTRGDAGVFTDDTRTYLRDCHDHVVMILDVLENYRETASGLVEVHLGIASQKMNEVMKVLTIIGTIFIPLSFVTGLYGMNFDTSSPYNMPELSSPYGYPVMLLAMATATALLLWYLKRRGWLGMDDL